MRMKIRGVQFFRYVYGSGEVCRITRGQKRDECWFYEKWFR